MDLSMLIGILGRGLVHDVCMVIMKWHKPTFFIDPMRKLTNKLSSDVGSIKNKQTKKIYNPFYVDTFHNAMFLVCTFPSKISRIWTCSQALYNQVKKKKKIICHWNGMAKSKESENPLLKTHCWTWAPMKCCSQKGLLWLWIKNRKNQIRKVDVILHL